jgi:hypothetical protein
VNPEHQLQAPDPATGHGGQPTPAQDTGQGVENSKRELQPSSSHSEKRAPSVARVSSTVGGHGYHQVQVRIYSRILIQVGKSNPQK